MNGGTQTPQTAPRFTHKQKVLALLSDGLPHSHMEGYRLGVMLHSRAADLRKDGHDIRVTRDGDDYVYRLVGRLDAEACETGANASASSVPSEPPPELDGGTIDSDGQLTLTGGPFMRRNAA